MRQGLKTVLLLLAAGGIGFALSAFDVPGLLDGGDAAADPISPDGRKDPETGCDAIADGIRALVASDRFSDAVKAQILDGLLLNYRNMECGIAARTKLLLELVGDAAAEGDTGGAQGPVAP